MTRLIIIIDCLGSAGKERQVVELLKGLDSHKNFKVKVVLLSNLIQYDEVYDLNCEIEIVERKGIGKKDLSIFKKLYTVFKDFQPDIVHSWERMCTIYALPISKLVGAKFINGTIQNATANPKKFRKRWIQERFTFPLSDAIVSNTMAGLKTYKVPKKKGYYVYNGFDFSRINNLTPKEEIIKKYKISTPLVVGMVGQFDHRKDFQTFIKSAIQILDRRSDVSFVSIGDGTNVRGDQMSTFELCKQMIPDKYKDKFIFTGRQTDVESIINIFSIGVLLSNYKKHGEGVSNSIIEYMALEKPVIATLDGGSPEIIVEGKNGFMIYKNDSGQYIKKLEYLLDNKDIAISMGKNGKKTIKEKFGIELMTQNFVDLYNKILGKN